MERWVATAETVSCCILATAGARIRVRVRELNSRKLVRPSPASPPRHQPAGDAAREQHPDQKGSSGSGNERTRALRVRQRPRRRHPQASAPACALRRGRCGRRVRIQGLPRDLFLGLIDDHLRRKRKRPGRPNHDCIAAAHGSTAWPMSNCVGPNRFKWGRTRSTPPQCSPKTARRGLKACGAPLK